MLLSAYKIIGFCCENALIKEKEPSGNYWLPEDSNIKVSLVPCSSKADVLSILKALESGADGVFIISCAEEDCSLLQGSRRTKNMVSRMKKILDEIGVGGERLQMFYLESPDQEHFEQLLDSMINKIKELEVTNHKE